MPTYEFSENNSGGSWWLKEPQFKALFAAGWRYEPPEEQKSFASYDKPFVADKDDTVPYGWRKCLRFDAPTIREAVESWEKATGKNFFDAGCGCCGAPFSITTAYPRPEGVEYEYISGDSVERVVVRPW